MVDVHYSLNLTQDYITALIPQNYNFLGNGKGQYCINSSNVP